MDKAVNESDFKIMEGISKTSNPSIRSLAELLGMKVPDVRRRVSFLTGCGLIAQKSAKRNVLELTGRGRFFLEKRDPKIATGYSPGESVPDHSAFRFALGEGLMTGDVAHSYREFLDVVKKVDSRSLVFHLYRGDFDNWISEIFRDKRLRTKFVRLKARVRPVDQLRTKMIRILEGRIQESEES